jgi:hypothetical protein
MQQRPSHLSPSFTARLRLLGAASSLMLLLTGCVADDPQKPKVGPAPTNPEPSTMFMAAQALRDTNANGYLDTCLITVYIFQSGYARSVHMPGTFDFKLMGKAGAVIREWKLASAGPNVGAVNAGVGPGYVIKLSLLDNAGTDVFQGQSGDIIASFTDAKGRSVQAEPTTVLLGKPLP